MLSEIQQLSESPNFSLCFPNEPEKFRYWFRASELCEVLFSKGNSHKFVTLHCKDWQYREFQVGMGRPALYVCESGVYRLILRSKAPIALEFQDWLTEEVLPKLRSQGGYIRPDATNDQIIALLKPVIDRLPDNRRLQDALALLIEGKPGAAIDEANLAKMVDRANDEKREKTLNALKAMQNDPGRVSYYARYWGKALNLPE